MRKKMLIVLFGRGSHGKTTSLRELVKKLCGHDEPVFNNQLSKVMNPNGHPKDVRFIIEYHGYYIFVATGGDNWGICRVNTLFFERESSGNVDVWLVEKGNIKELGKEDKHLFKSITPTVCVTSCRPDGDGYGALKAINNYVEKTMSRAVSKSLSDLNESYERIIWLSKFDGLGKASKEAINKNANTKAVEMKALIDDYLGLGNNNNN